MKFNFWSKSLWKESGKYLIDSSKIILAASIIVPIFQNGELPPLSVFVATLCLFSLGLYCVRKGDTDDNV
jgi:hypothetical protein